MKRQQNIAKYFSTTFKWKIHNNNFNFKTKLYFKCQPSTHSVKTHSIEIIMREYRSVCTNWLLAEEWVLLWNRDGAWSSSWIRLQPQAQEVWSTYSPSWVMRRPTRCYSWEGLCISARRRGGELLHGSFNLVVLLIKTGGDDSCVCLCICVCGLGK